MISFLLGAMFSVAFFPVWQMEVFFVPAGIIVAVMIHDVLRFRPNKAAI
jgi:hypothetical protein